MKRVLVGLAAVGGIVVVGVLARRVTKAMAAHAREMARQCEQMLAASGRGEQPSAKTPTAAESRETERAGASATV